MTDLRALANLTQFSDLIKALTVAIEENTRIREIGEKEFVGKEAIASIINRHPNNIHEFHEGGKQKSGWIYGVHYIRLGLNKGPWSYNRPLIEDWQRNRHDPAAHQRAIENYEKSKLGNRKARRRTA